MVVSHTHSQVLGFGCFLWFFVSLPFVGSDASSFNNSVADQQVGLFLHDPSQFTLNSKILVRCHFSTAFENRKFI